MRVLVQRVSESSVKIDGIVKGQISKGLLVLVGLENDDSKDDIDWICQKLVNLRIFNDVNGKMNLSIQDIKGELLVISQFTLHASIKKGNRPSYIKAAKPEIAIPLYESFLQKLKELSVNVESGEFGADMKVSLINDGPVSIWMDSKNKE